MQKTDWPEIQRKEDLDDLQRELSGQDGARVQRFLRDDDPRSREGRRKKAERRFRDLLERLLDDPEYRALYEQLGNELSSAEYDADSAISDLEQKLADLQIQIDALENAAARGPDGQPVFKTADGRVVSADGQALPREIADGIIWPANAPTAEDYFALKQSHRDFTDLLDQWRTYRFDVLGDIRDRYDDRDNPMSKDDLRDAIQRIEDLRPAPASLETKPSQEAQLSPAPQAFLSFN